MNPYVDTVADLSRLIAPPLITVFGGGLLVQKFFVTRANEAVLIDFLIKELDELRNDTLEYWNLAPDTKESKHRQTILTQKIKGSFKILSAEVGHFCERYCKKKASEMNKLLEEISDACTGGDFESAKKKADSGRYLPVVNSINRLKSELLRRKL